MISAHLRDLSKNATSKHAVITRQYHLHPIYLIYESDFAQSCPHLIKFLKIKECHPLVFSCSIVIEENIEMSRKTVLWSTLQVS